MEKKERGECNVLWGFPSSAAGGGAHLGSSSKAAGGRREAVWEQTVKMGFLITRVSLCVLAITAVYGLLAPL